MMEEHARLSELCLAAKFSLLITNPVIKIFQVEFSSVTDSSCICANDLHLTLSPVTQEFRPGKKKKSCNALRCTRIPS